MHARVVYNMYVLGMGKGVLFREVSSVQECHHRERGNTVHTQHVVVQCNPCQRLHAHKFLCSFPFHSYRRVLSQ